MTPAASDQFRDFYQPNSICKQDHACFARSHLIRGIECFVEKRGSWKKRLKLGLYVLFSGDFAYLCLEFGFSSIGLEFWNGGLAVSQGLEFYIILYPFNLDRLYTYGVQ